MSEEVRKPNNKEWSILGFVFLLGAFVGAWLG